MTESPILDINGQSINPNPPAWMHSFYGGELLPWKGYWFKVIGLHEKGLILEIQPAKGKHADKS